MRNPGSNLCKIKGDGSIFQERRNKFRAIEVGPSQVIATHESILKRSG